MFFCNLFSKLRFVISVLNNITIMLFNLAEYPLTLANSAHGIVGKVLNDIPLEAYSGT